LKPLADTVFLSESTITISSSKLLTETVYFMEAETKAISSLFPSETAYLSESFSYEKLISFTESVNLAETMSRAHGKTIADDLFLSEGSWFATRKTLTENLNLMDSTPIWGISQVRSEDAYIHEIFTLQTGDLVLEDFLLRETLTKRTSLTDGEGGYLSEDISRLTQKSVVDDIYLLENFSYIYEKLISFTESVNLSELFEYHQGKLFSDEVYLSESFSFEHFAETIHSFERPYITKIISIPVITGVMGFAGKGGHA
jgi:predicted lipase